MTNWHYVITSIAIVAAIVVVVVVVVVVIIIDDDNDEEERIMNTIRELLQRNMVSSSWISHFDTIASLSIDYLSLSILYTSK